MEQEIAIRHIFFILIFILVALLEIRMPRRALTTSKKWRWFNNLSIIAINLVLLRLVFPVFAIEMAQTAQVMGSHDLSQPSKGHQDMVIGLSQFRDHRRLALPWFLILPVIGDLGKQPINR